MGTRSSAESEADLLWIKARLLVLSEVLKMAKRITQEQLEEGDAIWKDMLIDEELKRRAEEN